jgi:polyribonucleotide 5'-hydroxyl-kinase
MATRTQRLTARSEFRFELEPGERISLRLVPDSGDAEVFGAELVPGKERWYAFGDEAKAAISTWAGCELEMSTVCTHFAVVTSS